MNQSLEFFIFIFLCYPPCPQIKRILLITITPTIKVQIFTSAKGALPKGHDDGACDAAGDGRRQNEPLRRSGQRPIIGSLCVLEL
jgi:hypothetical protein